MESICYTALKAGCEAESVISTRTETYLELSKAATTFDVQAVFQEAADEANVAGITGETQAGILSSLNTMQGWYLWLQGTGEKTIAPGIPLPGEPRHRDDMPE